MFLSKCKIHMAALLLVLLGSSLALAQKGDGPVEFSMRSVDGQPVTSESLRGEAFITAPFDFPVSA